MAWVVFAAGIAAALLEIASGVFVRSQTSGGEESSTCTCRNWRDTYASGGVRCGDTNEFFFATGRSSLESYLFEEHSHRYGREFCTQFFETINDNYCINVNMGADRGQWCYVDAACPDLGAGTRLNGQVGWKTCSPLKDKMLRTYKPEAIAKLAREQSLELGLLNKMSYPLSNYRWKYVSSFWGGTLDELTSVPQDLFPGVEVDDVKELLQPLWGKRKRAIDDRMKAELKDIADIGTPVTFDTGKDHHPPHVIVQGRTVYVVLPSSKAAMLCVYGCKH